MVPFRQAEVADTLSDLSGGDLVVRDHVGAGRCSKSVVCTARSTPGTASGSGTPTPFLAKVYVLRPISHTPSNEIHVISSYVQSQTMIRDVITHADPSVRSHLLPMTRITSSERGALVVRAYAYSTLRDRLGTRPFPTFTEKRWLIYQMISAVAQLHNLDLCHGDIKTDNFVVSSWGHVSLTDFAPHKPVVLPVDNPAPYSYFFDTDGRRRGSVAPERFTAGTVPHGASRARPSMDLFALGCSVAEVLLDGHLLLDFSQLVAFRSGELDFDALLDMFPAGPLVEETRGVVRALMHRDPHQRPSARDVLCRYQSSLFSPSFGQVVDPIFMTALEWSGDARVEAIRQTMAATRHVTDAVADALLLPLVCVCLREAVGVTATTTALDMIHALDHTLDTTDLIAYALPHVLNEVHSSVAVVRAAAARYVTSLLPRILSVGLPQSFSRQHMSERGLMLLLQVCIPAITALVDDVDAVVAWSYVTFLTEMASWLRGGVLNPALFISSGTATVNEDPSHELPDHVVTLIEVYVREVDTALRSVALASHSATEASRALATLAPTTLGLPRILSRSEQLTPLVLEQIRRVERVLADASTGDDLELSRVIFQSLARVTHQVAAIKTNDLLHNSHILIRDVASPQVQFMCAAWVERFRVRVSARDDTFCHEPVPVATVEATGAVFDIMATLARRRWLIDTLIPRLVDSVVRIIHMTDKTMSWLVQRGLKVLVAITQSADDADLYAILGPILWEAFPSLMDAGNDAGTGTRTGASTRVLRDLRCRRALHRAVMTTRGERSSLLASSSPSAAVVTTTTPPPAWQIHTPIPPMSTTQPDAVPRAGLLLAHDEPMKADMFPSVLYVEEKVPEHGGAVALQSHVRRAGVVPPCLHPRTPPFDWTPRGVLVSHVYPHRQAIRAVAKNVNHTMVATASADGTSCVYMTRDVLGPDEHAPAITIPGTVDRTAISFFSHTHHGSAENSSPEPWLAVGDACGRVSLYDVSQESLASPHWDLGPHAGSVVKLIDLDGMLATFSQHGVVTCLDPRMKDPAWNLSQSPTLGFVTGGTVMPSARGLTAVTSEGYVVTYDMRMSTPNRPLASWRHPLALPILGLATVPDEESQDIHPHSAWLATPGGEAARWGLLSGAPAAVVRVGTCGLLSCSSNAVDSLPLALQEPAHTVSGDAYAGLRPSWQRLVAESTRHQAVPTGSGGAVSALLPLVGGRLIAGGTDRTIHVLSPRAPKRSYIMCAPYHELVYPGEAGDVRSSIVGREATGGGSVGSAQGRAKRWLKIAPEDPATILQQIVSIQYRSRQEDGVPVLDELVSVDRRVALEMTRVDADATEPPDRRWEAMLRRADNQCHRDMIMGLDWLRAEDGEEGARLLTWGREGVLKVWK